MTFDTEYDTPAVLKAYGQRYNYDPAHWSFLIGPPDKIAELAALNDVNFDRKGGLYDHNFRTLIIDPAGALQMAFPITGDISDEIAAEILKALKTPDQPAPSPGPDKLALRPHRRWLLPEAIRGRERARGRGRLGLKAKDESGNKDNAG